MNPEQIKKQVIDAVTQILEDAFDQLGGGGKGGPKEMNPDDIEMLAAGPGPEGPGPQGKGPKKFPR